MKKKITLRLCIVIVISMLFTASLSFYFQVKSAQEVMTTNSLIRINQISQLLDKNHSDIDLLKEDLEKDYFIRAKAAAYIVQNQPEVIENQEEMKKIASLLQVDEFHLFDTEGTLYAGSEPKYFNYNFNSGEQMQFFLPMLEDYSLQLCQDVSANTAENKQMQYTAVWREDHQGIVQIGMEPTRLLNAMDKNELSTIFNMISAEKGITIFAIDPETGSILGSTDNTMVGKNTKDFGSTLLQTTTEKLTLTIDGKQNYCIIQPACHVLVGVSNTYENLYQNTTSNMILIIASLSILSIIIILLILRMLDRFIIQGIYSFIIGMKRIAAGDLDYCVAVDNSPEFVELSQNINAMVKSLLEATSKLSLIFQNVNIPIAVYEYNQDMKRVLATNKIGDILMLSQEDHHKMMADRTIFSLKMEEICSRLSDQEKDVYLIGKDEFRYVKIKSYTENNKTLGIVVDVTDEIVEKQIIKFERDIDLLTGLLSRRALFYEVNELYLQPQTLENAAVLMIDMDNLKYVNDTWGHECGDLLLKSAADLLKSCNAPNKITARLSGDEFVLLIYGANSQEEIQDYIDELYHQILHSTITVTNQEEVPIRLSGGYVFFSEHLKNFKEILHLADQTMYQVKKNNKGHFAKYPMSYAEQ